MGISLDDLKKKNQVRNQRNYELLNNQSTEVSTISNKSLELLKNNIDTSLSISDRVDSYSVSIIDKTTEELRNAVIELVFLIDQSGSCQGLESATSKGFWKLITIEKNNNYSKKVSTFLFNHNVTVKNFREDIKNIKPLKYRAIGSTALYDAFCDSINKILDARKKDQNKPMHSICAIMTDGYDTCSYHTKNEMKNLIQRLKQDNWEFIFIGTYEDVNKTAIDLGIDPNNIAKSINTERGMIANFDAVINAIEDISLTGKISENWSKPIINTTTNNTNVMRLEKH